jgi:hypothetical protein
VIDVIRVKDPVQRGGRTTSISRRIGPHSEHRNHDAALSGAETIALRTVPRLFTIEGVVED